MEETEFAIRVCLFIGGVIVGLIATIPIVISVYGTKDK